MTILIVDDDPGVLELNRLRFAKFGDVRMATSLREAHEQMRKIPPPDLVLLDLIFSEPPHISTAEETMRHIELIKQVNPQAFVVVYTGSADEKLRDMALGLGADTFIRKQDAAVASRLYHACLPALSRFGGQNLLDTLNGLFTPAPA